MHKRNLYQPYLQQKKRLFYLLYLKSGGLKTCLFISIIFLFPFIGHAQLSTTEDSAKVLENIVVNVYEVNSKLLEVPAAMSRVGSKDLDRYDNVSLVQAINTKPGVRMDERSPGSYRINIRGSSLRSPFGVRNVKVYYNGIPFTGPDGGTDLNELGFYNISSMEIIKGPASSMYGAGTGGAILINSFSENYHPGFSAAYTRGSYNTNNLNAELRLGNQETQNTIGFQHLSSDGYRDHTNMQRNVLSWNGLLKKTEKTTLQSTFFYSDLKYQTPGALNKQQYDANPRAARPAAGILPGAEEAKAAFYQKRFFSGLSLKQQITKHLTNNTSIYSTYNEGKNPTFLQYSIGGSPGIGGRTNFQFNQEINGSELTVNLGAEYQKNFDGSVKSYANNGGSPGQLHSDDEISMSQEFAYLQGNLRLQSGWVFSLGASVNKSKVGFKRFSVIPTETEKRDFKNELAPRVAVLKEINSSLSVYGSVARGFSPPATSEIFPTSRVFNTTLEAESGTDFEIGTRGSFIQNKLFFDVNAFRYRLKNSIVQRQDANGAIFYENAGSTKQLGLETYVSYVVIDHPHSFLNYGFVYASNTSNNFKYGDYQKLNNDFTGNKLTGAAPQTTVLGADLTTSPGIYAHLTYFHSGKIPLNDANSEFADSYDLFGIKLGYKQLLTKGLQSDLFFGVQNLFNEKYSLGNDINAANGRYYNVAPGRNYYLGIAIRFDKGN